MASINISEQDFDTLFNAAHLAKENGDMELAKKIDKIARKINASLSNAKFSKSPFKSSRDNLSWKEINSVFKDIL
jgi:ATP-dependent Lon protease